uniref:Uncharacterized protein n=1 Tax=Arundo donax TaxID=35708 RepID=A0A0A8ZK76_ARUDO
MCSSSHISHTVHIYQSTDRIINLFKALSLNLCRLLGCLCLHMFSSSDISHLAHIYHVN